MTNDNQNDPAVPVIVITANGTESGTLIGNAIYTAPEPGCYVDGHWGQYATCEMLAVAESFGWKTTDEIDLAREAWTSSDPSYDDQEIVIEAADEAEEWLNVHANDPEAPWRIWHWHDGEFYFGVPWDCDIDILVESGPADREWWSDERIDQLARDIDPDAPWDVLPDILKELGDQRADFYRTKRAGNGQ